MAREIRSGFLRRFRTWFGLALFGVAAALQGCGGGGGGSAAAPVAGSGNGELTVAMRDASGDFLSYTVDVTSLRLSRANGDVVETVPLTSRIDFSEVAELTEFFTVATIPSGIYTRVVMNLDFTHSQIVVQSDTGAELPAVAVDASGNPLTTLTVAIELPDTEPVRIAPGIPAAITLDFDLDASNTVDLTTNPAKVTVQPFLSVIPQLEQDRDHRVRGVLAAVDSSASSVTLNVRPFHLRQGGFGNVTFNTDDQTHFEVNGAALVGADGLAAMAALAQGTPVVANGTVSSRTLTASTVLAGSSVPWANGDVVNGVVTARNGDSLTVKGADFDFADGSHGFRGAFTVLVGDDTRVTSLDSDTMARTKDSISVGSRIIAFGQMSDVSTLDATAGRVRLVVTRLTGNVVQLDPLAVNLVELGGLRPSAFDFAGTGSSASSNADPTHYLIDTSTLSLTGIGSNDLIKARGFVHAFGAASPAFDARTVIDVDTDSIGAWFWASWRQNGGSADPFSTVAQDRVDMDLTDARHSLNLLGIPGDSLGDNDRVALSGPTDARGIYMVTVRGANEVHLFRDFAGLTPALSDQLAAGNRLVQVNAIGRYNATALELTTPRASFEFTTP
jgi:hypothetical protein